MEGNDPEDKYFYEVLVETGPLASHATTSKVNFILTGEFGNSGIKTLNHPDKLLHNDFTEKIPFQKGAVDAFLLTTKYPLGDLNYLRIWTDSSGLGTEIFMTLCKHIIILELPNYIQ